MSLRPHSLLCTALILALAMPPVGIQPLAQEDDPAAPANQDPAAEEPQEDETGEDVMLLTDRLTLRVGPAGVHTRASTRSDSLFRDSQTGEKVTQVNNIRFQGASGAGFVADAWYEAGKGWYVIGSLASASLGSGDYTDSRSFASRGGPGDKEYVRWGAEHTSSYLEWAIGGARRVFPTKRYKDSSLYVDAILLFGGTEADYSFDNGRTLNNPFDAPAFNPSFGFDPRGIESASFDMSFRTLMAGVRFGGELGERFSLEGEFLPTWFGRYEGTADLGRHGTALAHTPGVAHNRIDNPKGAGLGVITQFDLFSPTVEIEQDSSRARGLKVGLNSYVILFDWLTLDFGFERNYLRSVGGTESRIYSDEDIAGCPQPVATDPNGNPVTLAPNCGNDRGDLLTSRITSDTIYVMGRFHLY